MLRELIFYSVIPKTEAPVEVWGWKREVVNRKIRVSGLRQPMNISGASGFNVRRRGRASDLLSEVTGLSGRLIPAGVTPPEVPHLQDKTWPR